MIEVTDVRRDRPDREEARGERDAHVTGVGIERDDGHAAHLRCRRRRGGLGSRRPRRKQRADEDAGRHETTHVRPPFSESSQAARRRSDGHQIRVGRVVTSAGYTVKQKRRMGTIRNKKGEQPSPRRRSSVHLDD